jgi:dCTP diphosphatase
LIVGADPIGELQRTLREFAAERDWEQFHTPKNLAMALAGEVGELIEIFQWMTPEEAASVMASDRAVDVEDELADICIYLLRLADVLRVDLPSVAERKIARNDQRYPVSEVSGRADVAPVD